jgi:hypothetical protein
MHHILTFTHSVPHYLEEDEKLRASSLKIRRGGNCPNSLEVFQQLAQPQDAVRMYLVSPLPSESSPATQRVKASFGESSPVSLEHCLYREMHTEAASSYIIRSEQTGSRTIVNYNNLPEMTIGEFEAIVRRFSSDDETWWHFEVSPFSLSFRPKPYCRRRLLARKSRPRVWSWLQQPTELSKRERTPLHLIL